MKVSHNLLLSSFVLLLAVKELMYIINESKSQRFFHRNKSMSSCERTNVHHK